MRPEKCPLDLATWKSFMTSEEFWWIMGPVATLELGEEWIWSEEMKMEGTDNSFKKSGLYGKE